MKKTTTKAVLPPAPAKKDVVKTVKKSAAPAGRKKTAAPAPAVKSGSPAPVLTVITAKIDVGFGNALYLRGEGAGLSWDRGRVLDCVEDDVWSIKLPETSKPVIFKFLVNDLTWSVGPDYTVAPGSKAVFEPAF